MSFAELNAFTPDPGLESGRKAPDASDVGIRLDGASLFVLGHDAPGFTSLLKNGDVATLSQSMDLTGLTLLTFEPRTRPPSKALPAGFAWTASIFIGSTLASARVITGSAPMDWSTWSANVSKVGGVAAVKFTLALSGPVPVAPASPLTEVEVPAFYVEAITVANVAGPMLLNAQPDTNQGISTGSPPLDGTTIKFDLVDFGASNIKQSSIRVVVNGTDAVTGGVAQTGWAVAYANPSADTTNVTVTPSINFASGSVVAVSVYATTNANTPLVAQPTSWSFQVADTIPPQIVAASSRDQKTIRIVWDEAVVATTAHGSSSALNPDLYALAPQITIGGVVPAVTPVVISVSTPDGTTNTFDLTTDIEITPDVTYSLTATGVADLQGNAAVSAATFVAFRPPQPAGRNFDLWRRVARKNREEDDTQDLLRFVRCLQEVADLVLADVDTWSSILDIDVAPEDFLDAMLEDLSNPFPFTLAEIDKRRLLRVLVDLYKKKGSPDSIVEAALFFLGLTITITGFSSEGYCVLGVSELGVDWILGPGTRFARYAFRIVSASTLTAKQRSQLITIANILKPAHTHLIEIVEPGMPPVYDPVELGVSQLGVDWLLH